MHSAIPATTELFSNWSKSYSDNGDSNTSREDFVTQTAAQLSFAGTTLPWLSDETLTNFLDKSVAMGSFEPTIYPTSHQSLFATTNSSSTPNVSFLQDTSIERYFGIVIGIFDILAGSIGNFMTLVAIWSNKKLHKPFYILIANLCVIDFLTSAFMMPFNVTSYVTKTWPFGEQSFTCSFMAYCYYSCGYSSIICLLTITVNRFVGIVFPKRYCSLFTRKRILITIVISWVFAPFFLAPFFFFKDHRDQQTSSFKSNGFAWNSQLSLCVFNVDLKIVEEYMQFTRVLFQLAPLFIMVTLYTKIFFTSKQSRRAVTNISLKTDSEPTFLERCRTYSETLKRPNIQLSPLFNKVLRKKACSSVDEVFSSDIDLHKNVSRFERALPGHSSARKCNLETANKVHLSSSTVFSEDLDDNGHDAINRDQPKERNLHLHFHYDKETCSSAPNSPMSGVRKTINMRSLQTCSSLYSVNNSPNLLHKTTLANRRPLSGSGNCSPTSLRSSHFGRSNDKYSSAIRLAAKKRKLIDRRLLQVSFTICATFTILFLPSAVISLVPGEKHPGVHMAASVVTWLNSCVNPIIYCFMNQKLREQYKLLLNKTAEFVCGCCRVKNNEHKRAPRSLRSSMRNYQIERK